MWGHQVEEVDFERVRFISLVFEEGLVVRVQVLSSGFRGWGVGA